MQIRLNTFMAIDKQGYLCYINFMPYPLHHSTKTLMPSTEDRQQTLAWSERRPSQHANKALGIETEFYDIESLVEKSGTGMRAIKGIGSRPPPGLLTCFTQCRFGLVLLTFILSLAGLPSWCQETDLALISKPWTAVETRKSLKSKGKLSRPEAI